MNDGTLVIESWTKNTTQFALSKFLYMKGQTNDDKDFKTSNDKWSA